MKAHLAYRKLLVMTILSVWAAASCTREPGQDGTLRHISLAMSVRTMGDGRDLTSKMSADITQSAGAFRGIEQLFVIPFQTEADAPVSYSDSRMGRQNVVLGSLGIGRGGLIANNNSHLFGSAFVPTGMNSVLIYGKAPDEGEDKHVNGSLTAQGLADPHATGDISFHLDPILNSGVQEVTDKADALLEQLNVIMSLLRQSKFASIVAIHDAVKRENHILACSYPTFDQLRQEIQNALWRIPYESQELLEEIRLIGTSITSFSNLLTETGTTFPLQYGIPEGAIGFAWNGKEFVRLIGGVNIALVNPDYYCYPPCLWYYDNSSVRTSNSDNVKLQYVPGNEQWEDILDFYTDGQSVSSVTQAVAVVDQLQYGVGMMELKLAEPGEEATSLANRCPLTGIIIGDQRDVDFSFLPGQGLARYIYDNATGGLRLGNTQDCVQTLVLQTTDGAPVHFALEFRNNSSNTLRCQQGDILPRCRFYLAGTLDPSDAAQPAGETLSSVFSRDHKTTVTVKIENFRNAYNTVPDLHSPQLEIGVVTEMKWTQLTPQSIVLDF